jgi:sugar/nucleoside kinase (ribokinase family)
MEAAALTKENDLERSAKVLLSFGCKHVVITQSSHGCTVFQHPQNQQSQHEDQQLTASSSAHQPAFYVEV